MYKLEIEIRKRKVWIKYIIVLKYFVYLFRQINFHQSLEGPTPANIKMFIYDLVLRADVYTLSTIN